MLPIAVTEPEELPANDRRQSLQTLERGMAVIEVFSQERPALSLSEVAQITGITRASARRILLTLQQLGHVRSDGRIFSPTPRLLALGWSYLASLNLWELAGMLMQELVDRTQESCAAATLDLPQIVYVAQIPGPRVMSEKIDVGSRLPATHTSLGRVLLAGLSLEDARRFLDDIELTAYTQRSITDRQRLAEEIDRTRDTGFCVVDEEYEFGLWSVAAPIRGEDGATIAAISVSASKPRVAGKDVRTRHVEALLETAEAVSTAAVQRQWARPGVSYNR